MSGLWDAAATLRQKPTTVKVQAECQRGFDGDFHPIDDARTTSSGWKTT